MSISEAVHNWYLLGVVQYIVMSVSSPLARFDFPLVETSVICLGERDVRIYPGKTSRPITKIRGITYVTNLHTNTRSLDHIERRSTSAFVCHKCHRPSHTRQRPACALLHANEYTNAAQAHRHTNTHTHIIIDLYFYKKHANILSGIIVSPSIGNFQKFSNYPRIIYRKYWYNIL